MSISGNREYTVSYRDMCGVDFSVSGTKNQKRRYAYTENMYRDYDGDGGSIIESVPGFRRIASFGGTIHGIYAHKNSDGESFTVVHASNKIYRFQTSMRDSLSNLAPIAEISDNKSSAFRHGENLYVIDGINILKISADGEATKITEDSPEVYVPTTFYNGRRIEQRNLLTKKFKEINLIGPAETLIYGTDGLMYQITNESLGLCAVVGIRSSFRGVLNIPSYARIGEKQYKVDEIADNAFKNNTNIAGVKIGIGLYRIGKFAFANCTALNTVYAGNAPAIIDNSAFSGCTTLISFFLGTNIQRFGSSVFNGCTNLKDIKYSSDESEFKKIENHEDLAGLLITSFTEDRSLTIEIKLSTPTSEISSVTLDGTAFTTYLEVRRSDLIISIIFSIYDRRTIEGKEIVIEGTAADGTLDAFEGSKDFISDTGYAESGYKAIAGCTLSENFDGRAFVSGNPTLPGTVFFTSRDNGKDAPLYFGVYNYFSDGFGTFGITSMLSAADSLLVFKKGDDGGGSIFYHTPQETGNDIIPKIYPVSYTHNGIGAIGKSISFFDDPVFISKNGVSAIDKRIISLDRSIACRSHSVNARLLSENLEEASLAEWCGYLALGINGKIFLADSRATYIHESGSREYEWYYLCDIGTRRGAARVYRYSSVVHSGYKMHETPEKIVTERVFSSTVNDETIYYTYIGNEKYEVHPTEEFSGGTLNPLTVLAGFENNLLFFGTSNGDLCIFNNDKRGVAPKRILSSADFDSEDYARYYARRIHPDFYSFNGHSMRCGARTAPYDCELPDITKNSVKHSLTLKCRICGSGKIKCEVKTNRSGYEEYATYPNGIPDFSSWNFSSLTLDSEETVSLPINEKEKNWIEKELSVYCDDFCSPIGIYSLTYRYKPKGRIKHS